MTSLRGFIAVVAAAAVLLWWAGTAVAQPFTGGLPHCEASLNMCSTRLSACQAAAQRFPATGQTTCSNSTGQVISCVGTGQDGDVQAGATLSYTDNGDGTITDNNTNLVWEKKSADGTIHDVNTGFYTWENAFTVHIAALNAANFAGHNDWRLPNVRELESIANYEESSPAVSPAFNTNCVTGVTVLNGSCTASRPYWTSTTLASHTTAAWLVSFSDGGNGLAEKGQVFPVRAVRGDANLGSSQ